MKTIAEVDMRSSDVVERHIAGGESERLAIIIEHIDILGVDELCRVYPHYAVAAPKIQYLVTAIKTYEGQQEGRASINRRGREHPRSGLEHQTCILDDCVNGHARDPDTSR